MNSQIAPLQPDNRHSKYTAISQASPRPHMNTPLPAAKSPLAPRSGNIQKAEPGDKSTYGAFVADSDRLATFPAKKETVFRLEAPNAKMVLLVGEFSQWERAPVKMIKGNRGIWRALVSLAPGRHTYRFVVDGEWQN